MERSSHPCRKCGWLRSRDLNAPPPRLIGVPGLSSAPRCAREEQRFAAAAALEDLRPCEGWFVELPASWRCHPPSADIERRVVPRFAASLRDRAALPSAAADRKKTWPAPA